MSLQYHLYNQLKDVLLKEQYNFPLMTIQAMYDLISNKNKIYIKTNGNLLLINKNVVTRVFTLFCPFPVYDIDFVRESKM